MESKLDLIIIDALRKQPEILPQVLELLKPYIPQTTKLERKDERK